MKTITSSHPSLFLALLMAQPPEHHPLPPLSASASPTPPSSLPQSPNQLQLPSLHALLQQFTAEEYCDDGVDLVMDMLNNEKAVTAPLPPPDVDRLLASWKSVDWGSTKASRSNLLKSPRNELSVGTNTLPHKTAASKVRGNRDWCYSEDCIVADVFTSVQPERQREELQRRLPKRSWSDAHRRFQTVCDQVCAIRDEQVETHATVKDWRKGFWRRRTNGKLKPQCLISKTLSKLR